MISKFIIELYNCIMSWHTNTSTPLPFDQPSQSTSKINQYEQTSQVLKLNYYIQYFNRQVETLHDEYKRRLPYDIICQLAHTVLDGTVFEIVKGLQEVQVLMEKSLSDRRAELIKAQRSNKKDMLKRQKSELSIVEKNKHQRKLLEKQHETQRSAFAGNCEKELIRLDKKLVVELDRQVCEQQSALYRAGLPFFRVTSDSGEIKVQMVVLQMIMGLAKTEWLLLSDHWRNIILWYIVWYLIFVWLIFVW